MTQVIETQGSPPADFPVDDDTGEFIVYAAPDMTAGGLQRVDTRRLLQGMFVAGLDRPWSDTPLPHGGLLVDSDAVLQSVRHYCRFVMVDADRSSSGLAAAIQAAAVLSADPMPDDGAWAPHAAQSAADVAAATAQHDTPRRAARAVNVPRPRDDVRPAEVTRAKILRLVRESDQAVPPPHGALSGVRRWLGLGRGKAADDSPDTRMLQREQALLRLRDRWGDAVGACDHGEGAPIRESIALARPVHARLVAATDIAVRQVRHGTPLALEPLVEVADALAASLANAPHAMRWLAAFHADNAATPNPATYAAVHLADFGRALGMELAALRELALIALLADVGKALLPRPVLEHPGVLEPSDFALMKQHVTIGLDILARAGTLPEAVLRGVAEHHERLDGSGYPAGLRAGAIGLHGRMAAIVDCYCALTAARAYANPLSAQDALAALHEWSGSLFCRDLVEQFVRAIGAFPVGTLVELQTGEVAAVVGLGSGNRLQPTLVMLTGPDKGPARRPPDATAARPAQSSGRRTQVRIARGLPAGSFGLRLRDYFAVSA